MLDHLGARSPAAHPPDLLLGSQQQQQLVHSPAHPPVELGCLVREPGSDHSGDHRLGDPDQGLLVQIGECQPSQLLLDDARKFGDHRGHFTGDVLPRLAQVRQSLV
jgi:hypothetical protein